MPPPTGRSDVVARLRAAGCVFAEDEADLLLAEALTAPEVEELIRRRVAGEPLETVLGWAEFCGLRLAVSPGVFVPRRRTALLAREAIARTAAGSAVLDICCGTGAVAAAIRAARPAARIYAVDLDPAAVRCARRNVVDADVFEGDLYAPLPQDLRGELDLIVANAPYVPTEAIALMPPEARSYEARIALDGGDDGLRVQRQVIAEAPQWLAPGGQLLVETGRAQAPHTEKAFARSGFAAGTVVDEEVDGTVVIGRWPGRAR